MEKMLFSTLLLIATSSLYEAHNRLFKNDIVLGWASQVALVVKNPCLSMGCHARDLRDAGSIPGSGRSPGGGHGNSL